MKFTKESYRTWGLTALAAVAVIGLGVWLSQHVGTQSGFSDENAVPVATVEFDSLQPGDTLVSPATLTGKARSDWFYSGALAVEARTDEGEVLGRGNAVALEEPRGVSMVPFSLQIAFETGSKRQSGFLVFIKSNPQGSAEDNQQDATAVVFSAAQ